MNIRYPQNDFEMVAKTFQGLEVVLADELKTLNAKDIKIGKRSVSFKGDIGLLYKSNIYLRTALSILVPVISFRVDSVEELYKKSIKLSWPNILKSNMTFSIDSVVHSKYFKHSKFAALKLKDAIVDKFMAIEGIRPSVDRDRPDIKMNLHISHDQCTISLDSSGVSLFKRGYRRRSTQAPLNEVLAAGMILLSDWDRKSTLIDPMCGSGTILIEAALIANNIPPGIYRKRFGFQNWMNFKPVVYQEIFSSISRELTSNTKLIGNDILEQAVQIAIENARSAGLKRIIEFEVIPIESYEPPSSENQQGFIISNPPYGERLKMDNIDSFYKALSDIFKNKYAGYSVWLLSNNLQAIKYFGLKPDKKITLFNGPLECKFLNYKIYKGSKKK